MSSVPEEIRKKYPKEGTLRFPKGDNYPDNKSVDTVKTEDAVFIEDSNSYREYWKGFELLEWGDGTKELRFCYWTRKRGTEIWRWGQFNPVVSLENLKKLMQMIENKHWFGT